MKLRHKRLLTLWDSQAYSAKKHQKYKPIDGLFVFQSLFSVGAFASKKDHSLSTQLAKRTADKLLLKVKAQRNSVNHLHRQLLNECGDIELNTFTPLTNISVAVEQEKLTPESAMLIKTFTACDEYFMSLYKARKNGELTEKEHQELRANLVSTMNVFLLETHKVCSSFHQIRKKRCEGLI